MPRNADVLLVTWDGAGNLPPERSLVRSLIARGHRVRALAHDSVRDALERDGVEFVRVDGLRRYDSMEPMSPREEMPFVLEHVWYAKAFGTALLAEVERARPDLLLVDVSLTYALVAARSTSLPAAVLGHFPYQLLLGPFAGLFASRLPETNAYATELGLGPFASHQAMIEAAPLVLVASYRPFDWVATTAPNVVHVGPCRSRDDAPAPWRRRIPARPLVVVGLSTSHQNQVPLLQRLCDALAHLDAEAVVTTGPSIAPELLRAADNTTVTRFVPHDVLLPSADLLVTHAGHGTVMAGVTYGVPMLCIPMGRDQPMIAARVAELGLGSLVDAEASVAEIERALVATLSDADARRRAGAFAKSLVGHPGLDDAVRLVEELLPDAQSDGRGRSGHRALGR